MTGPRVRVDSCVFLSDSDTPSSLDPLPHTHARTHTQLEQESQSRYWTGEEHHKFLEAIESFGPKDVKAIATFVGSRSATQACISYDCNV
jgi:hypothetical protein